MLTSGASVAIGMPVYNSEQWLRASLSSWLEQTFTGFKLVISDNASTDSSFQICSEFAARDSRIELHRNPRNIGICGNFRRVFQLSGPSEYFIWASSHDHFAPTMLERCVTTLEQRPDAVVCCGHTKLFEFEIDHAFPYEEKGGVDSDSPFERFRSVVEGIRINNFVHGVIRSSVLRETPLIGDYFSSDNVLVAQLALAGKIIQLPETLYYRRWEASASTSKMSELERRKHWDPDNRGMSRYTHWKINRGFLRAVLGADIPFDEKKQALLFALKGAYWDRKDLIADLGEGVREWIHRKSVRLA